MFVNITTFSTFSCNHSFNCLFLFAYENNNDNNKDDNNNYNDKTAV